MTRWLIFALCFIFAVVLFVPLATAEAENSRCDLGSLCDKRWLHINDTASLHIRLSNPCNVTIYNETKDIVFSVLSTVKNAWHNVSIPTTTLGIGSYSGDRVCNGSIATFGFDINKSLSTMIEEVNISIWNLTVNVNNTGVAEDVWTYNLSNNLTAQTNIVGGDMDWFAVAIIIVAGIYWYLAFSLGGDYRFLQILFVFMGLYMIIFSFGYMFTLANINSMADAQSLSEAMYWTGVILLIFMVFYLILVLIKNLLEGFHDGRINMSIG